MDIQNITLFLYSFSWHTEGRLRKPFVVHRKPGKIPKDSLGSAFTPCPISAWLHGGLRRCEEKEGHANICQCRAIFLESNQNLQEEITFNLLSTKTHKLALTLQVLMYFSRLFSNYVHLLVWKWPVVGSHLWCLFKFSDPNPTNSAGEGSKRIQAVEWQKGWLHTAHLLRKNQTLLLDFLGVLSSLSIEAPLRVPVI